MNRQRIRVFMKENRSFILFILLYVFTRTAYADWSPVPTGSMEPTIQPGDVLLVDKTAFGPSIPILNKRIATWAQPSRGDIITFVPPHTDDLYVKRVIGLPGDQIRVEGAEVFINGERLAHRPIERSSESIVIEESIGGLDHFIQISRSRPSLSREQVFAVPPRKYFVMGDHRNDSEDSRFWGYVDEERIMGKVKRIAVSFSSKREFVSSLGMSIE